MNSFDMNVLTPVQWLLIAGCLVSLTVLLCCLLGLIGERRAARKRADYLDREVSDAVRRNMEDRMISTELDRLTECMKKLDSRCRFTQREREKIDRMMRFYDLMDQEGFWTPLNLDPGRPNESSRTKWDS